MDRRHTGRQLLNLLSAAQARDYLSAEPTDWRMLASLAQQHRLEPWLDHLHRNAPEIPAALRAQWREANRTSVLTAMAQQADLRECIALLEKHGFSPVALKGAFLAVHAWPQPELRPMRDLDILVPQGLVMAAYRALIAAGYRPLEESRIALEDHARLEMHMPPLAMPHGSVLELHVRLSELSGRLEYATPAGNEAQVHSRAISIDGVKFPAPTDMLAHLVVHAIYTHRLDCGPLLLGDVCHLVRRHPIDWPRFWSAAQRDGWSKGAALVFALVRDSFGAAAVPRAPAEPPEPEAQLRELARDLILQDTETKKYARLGGALLSGGFGYAWRRATGRVAASSQVPVTIERAAPGGRFGWAMSQLGGLGRSLADPSQLRQARQLARFRTWLER